jgi:hypothetical protein
MGTSETAVIHPTAACQYPRARPNVDNDRRPGAMSVAVVIVEVVVDGKVTLGHVDIRDAVIPA